MNDAQFDLWTRRRIGVAAGGFAATLLGMAGIEVAATAKDTHKNRKKRRKRCKKLGRLCTPGKRKCCGDLYCRTTTLNLVVDTFCCRLEGEPCTEEHHCCGDLCCSPSGVCSSICFSDRARKANFGSVDPADMWQ